MCLLKALVISPIIVGFLAISIIAALQSTLSAFNDFRQHGSRDLYRPYIDSNPTWKGVISC